MTTPPLDLTALNLRGLRLAVEQKNPQDNFTIGTDHMAALLDHVDTLNARVEAAERDLAAVTVSRDGWQTRAEAAEAAVARVEAICQDTDGNWLNLEDECNNVGILLQAVRGGGA